MGSVFLTEDAAKTILKRHPRANSFLEEIKQGSIERECREEICTYEEAREAFENDEKTREFWREYSKGLQGDSTAGNSWYPFYLAFPLIVGLFVVLVVVLVVCKCVYRKKARTQSVYMRNGPQEAMGEAGLAADSSAYPHQQSSTLHSPMEELYDSIGMPVGFIGYGDTRSDSVSTRLSNCDPPPSYEEATGEVGVRDRETTEHHLDPPPHYEEIGSSSTPTTIVIVPPVTATTTK
ncbi:transmembrane gamma-carboxyglutamic acid protein 1 [Rhinatrema bivittatum]|uniref:transmembrane gamma-carboxyglutamic acid protein 1 n=1 Tax=Rhinatrema bivittatum TaxID=194408 RepID=UPI001126A6E2|nr:transmembrane gamma-carboxyglutamic acid protein 1 [Rhinatrema bivittatum]XP_029458970.1 transmembrane gamma-carboxyglutamic acid protein 1 [Rhinatrema bivittatum]XP_029458971.1 transmembrane gamma-carboxyglutamic acid protein 1 [Rhinatrema bivittatum]XP_029458972.1 transmembrane gamma-carboxyglutamic acid protein 1 [Rhinatrema bivittatum]